MEVALLTFVVKSVSVGVVSTGPESGSCVSVGPVVVVSCSVGARLVIVKSSSESRELVSGKEVVVVSSSESSNDMHSISSESLHWTPGGHSCGSTSMTYDSGSFFLWSHLRKYVEFTHMKSFPEQLTALLSNGAPSIFPK